MTKRVNKYRVYCTTEQAYIYVWDTHPPTSCTNNNAHTLDTSTTTILDSISEANTSVTNLYKSPFDELRTVEKTTVLELKSMFGKSSLRDRYNTSGTATVTNTVGEGEYVLAVNTSGDMVSFRSAERGRYIAGEAAEIGIGLRLGKANFDNGQSVDWGLFDNNDGFFYRYNSSGLNVVIKKAGVETIINKVNFLVDSLDGNGPSGLVYSPTYGYIYNIIFSWYGYGVIEFVIYGVVNNRQTAIPIHRYFFGPGTSVRNPNLPLNVELRNTTATSSAVVYVSGRQYSIIGKYLPILRVNTAYRLNVSVNSLVNFLHVMSIRRKAGYEGNAIRVTGIDLRATTDQIVQIRVGSTLTGSNFVAIPDQVTDESVMLYDVSSTNVSGGIIIWCGFVTSNRDDIRGIDNLNFVLSELDNITVCSRAVSQTNGQISAVMRWSEEW